MSSDVPSAPPAPAPVHAPEVGNRAAPESNGSNADFNRAPNPHGGHRHGGGGHGGQGHGNQGHGNQGGGNGGQGGEGKRNKRRRRRRGKNRGPVAYDANGQAIPLAIEGGGQPQGAQPQGGGQPQQAPGAPVQAEGAAATPAAEGAPSAAPGQPQQALQSNPQGNPQPQQHFQRPPRPQPPPVQLFPIEGVLDTEVKGPFAFLRNPKRHCAPSPEDAEVPRALVQKMRLRAGQLLTGQAFQRGARPQLQRVDAVEGMPPEEAIRAPHFQDLTSIDPTQRIDLEHDPKEMVTRVLDLVAPIGFGQRGLIVAPPKTGKTIMLMRIARAVAMNHPKAKLIVLLIDERPEEVTDMRRNIQGEVVASSSDRTTAEHVRLAELTLERAKRLVERGEDVVILMDSITRLARAYNKETSGGGRTMSGGMDQNALEKPKKLFGAARKAEEGGSLTILGTALVDTGSRMDEVIFEEFKGTGNMEVVLDRQLSERRVFPAINMPASGTRKDEKLVERKEYEKVKKLRQLLYAMKPSDAMDKLTKKLAESTYNDEFLDEL